MFAAAWPDHAQRDIMPVISRSVWFVYTHASDRLVGFVNFTWDGGIDAFILNTTVHRHVQRGGIRQQLVRNSVVVAHEHGVEWSCVDFEPHLSDF